MAQHYIIERGYAQEVQWQEVRSLTSLAESDFLRECAWVILNSGMRESIVRAKFPRIVDAFMEFESAHHITGNAEVCRRRALEIVRHEGKIDAIIRIAHTVHLDSFEAVLLRIRTNGVNYLRELPYIGPVTCFHLAKNIGLDTAKPDRHLTRIAQSVGCRDAAELCGCIARALEEKISVVDSVLWRYATLDRDYASVFARAAT